MRYRHIPLLLLLPLLAACDKETREEIVTAPQAAPTASTAAQNTLERIAKSQLLRIGVKADNPPFCFQDKEGRPQGFDVELGHRIARGLKSQPVYVTVTSNDRIAKLKAGEVDIVIATLTATRRRAKE